jgi:hypothetical protein
MAAATVGKFDVTSNFKSARKDIEREAVDSFWEPERAEKAGLASPSWGMARLRPEKAGGRPGDVPSPGDRLCFDENGRELAPAAEGVGDRQGGGPAETVITRPNQESSIVVDCSL